MRMEGESNACGQCDPKGAALSEIIGLAFPSQFLPVLSQMKLILQLLMALKTQSDQRQLSFICKFHEITVSRSEY